jgi:hypothetical protein
MIVAAAVRLPAKPDPYKPTVQDLILFVPAPGRHHNVLHSLHDNFKAPRERAHESYAGEVQGFLTDKGEFLDRRAAFQHVKECGQPMIRQMGVGYQGDELFSEDLW